VQSVAAKYHKLICQPSVMHVSQFLVLYGNIGIFTEQGLEKLNDFTTKFFQHGSNHKEQGGHQRKLKEQKCTKCKKEGHNKRICHNLTI